MHSCSSMMYNVLNYFNIGLFQDQINLEAEYLQASSINEIQTGCDFLPYHTCWYPAFGSHRKDLLPDFGLEWLRIWPVRGVLGIWGAICGIRHVRNSDLKRRKAENDWQETEAAVWELLFRARQYCSPAKGAGFMHFLHSQLGFGPTFGTRRQSRRLF